MPTCVFSSVSLLAAYGILTSTPSALKPPLHFKGKQTQRYLYPHRDKKAEGE